MPGGKKSSSIPRFERASMLLAERSDCFLKKKTGTDADACVCDGAFVCRRARRRAHPFMGAPESSVSHNAGSSSCSFPVSTRKPMYKREP